MGPQNVKAAQLVTYNPHEKKDIALLVLLAKQPSNHLYQVVVILLQAPLPVMIANLEVLRVRSIPR